MIVQPLRDRIHAWLRERLVTGEFAPGVRLRDTDLAQELGVSRTPVREALLRLETEGLVEATPNRGFSVPGMRPEEVREIYPLVAVLERLAVTSSEPPEAASLQALRQLSSKMGQATNQPARRMELDRRWHALLIARCQNRRLLALLVKLKQIVRRYELVYMRETALVLRSAREHNEIVEALARNRGAAVPELVERHWHSGMRSILQCLETMNADKTKPAKTRRASQPAERVRGGK